MSGPDCLICGKHDCNCIYATYIHVAQQIFLMEQDEMEREMGLRLLDIIQKNWIPEPPKE